MKIDWAIVTDYGSSRQKVQDSFDWGLQTQCSGMIVLYAELKSKNNIFKSAYFCLIESEEGGRWLILCPLLQIWMVGKVEWVQCSGKADL